MNLKNVRLASFVIFCKSKITFSTESCIKCGADEHALRRYRLLEKCVKSSVRYKDRFDSAAFPTEQYYHNI